MSNPTPPTTPPIPRTPEIRLRIQEEVRNVANGSKQKADKTYTTEINKYKKWIDGKEDLFRNGKYLSRENVDFYFAEVQSTQDCVSNTGRRVVSALQYYADNVEFAGDADGFKVESHVVLKMLQAQKHNKKQNVLNTSRDYHVKLTVKNLSVFEKSKIVRHVIKNDKMYWSDFLTTWNLCCSTFAQVASVLEFRLSDLYIDRSHSVGAIKKDFTDQYDQQLMGIILRPYLHKEQATEPRVIGAYRHRDPYMCATGSVAMNLFLFLNAVDPEEFNFLEPQGNVCNNIRIETERRKNKNYVEPKWSKCKFIRKWKDTQGASTTYKKVFKETKIDWEKLTHLRKSGIEDASAGGLDTTKISTMSKHQANTGSSKIQKRMPRSYYRTLCYGHPVMI
jgi:hypothetical protein